MVVSNIEEEGQKFSQKNENQRSESENEIIEIADYLRGLETLEEQCAYVYQDSFNSDGHFFPDYVGSYLNINSKKDFIQATRKPLESFLKALIANKHTNQKESFYFEDYEIGRIWNVFLSKFVDILLTDSDNDDQNFRRQLPVQPETPVLAM